MTDEERFKLTYIRNTIANFSFARNYQKLTQLLESFHGGLLQHIEDLNSTTPINILASLYVRLEELDLIHNFHLFLLNSELITPTEKELLQKKLAQPTLTLEQRVIKAQNRVSDYPSDSKSYKSHDFKQIKDLLKTFQFMANPEATAGVMLAFDVNAVKPRQLLWQTPEDTVNSLHQQLLSNHLVEAFYDFLLRSEFISSTEQAMLATELKKSSIESLTDPSKERKRFKPQ